MKNLIIIIISLLPTQLFAIAKEQVELLAIFDNHFISEEFAKEAQKGALLAFQQNKQQGKNSLTKSYHLQSDEHALHPINKTHKTNSVAALGFTKLDRLSLEQIAMLGLFEGEMKDVKPDTDFFNLQFTLNFGKNHWPQVLSTIYKAKKIVILGESVDFIDRNLDSLTTELKSAQIELETFVIPSLNNLAIKNAVTKLKKNDFDLILTINSFNKSFKFINMARRLGIEVPVLFLSIDGKNKEFFIPSPFDTKSPLALEYLSAINRQPGESSSMLTKFESKAQASLAGFIGYLIARTAMIITDNIKGPITAQSFIKAANAMKEIKEGFLLVKLSHNSVSQNDLIRQSLIKEYQ